MGSLRAAAGGGGAAAAAGGGGGMVSIPTVDAERRGLVRPAQLFHTPLYISMSEIGCGRNLTRGMSPVLEMFPTTSLSPHTYGKEKNPHFVEQVSALYAKDQNLIVGCRSGIRSTADLINAGFKNVKNLEVGYLSLLRSAN